MSTITPTPWAKAVADLSATDRADLALQQIDVDVWTAHIDTLRWDEATKVNALNEQLSKARARRAAGDTLTQADRASEANKPPTPTWDTVRNIRSAMLDASDWMATQDRTMTQAEKAYRQALRDIPQTFGAPAEVVWP